MVSGPCHFQACVSSPPPPSYCWQQGQLLSTPHSSYSWAHQGSWTELQSPLTCQSSWDYKYAQEHSYFGGKLSLQCIFKKRFQIFLQIFLFGFSMVYIHEFRYLQIEGHTSIKYLLCVCVCVH
uniref:Uncharacterized protein n=1 Tax=Sphaerodactylus townsendi TaxID=933632 RepID=A0ACB8GDU8_9SAUR